MLNEGRLAVFAICLVGGYGHPAVAQTATTAPAQSPGVDADVSTGSKRPGVIAGQNVECAPDATRAAEIGKASGIGDDIAVESGLRASFDSIGAAGHGSGKPLNEATCADIVKQWKAVQAEYGER